MEDKRDLTTGSIGKKLIAFSLPIMAINLLQAVYNMVDMVIVGQFVGPVGMSAVSVGGQVTTLILNICLGLSNGLAAYIGQLFGAKKMEEADSMIGSFLSFLTLLALSLTAVTIALRTPLLHALNTPDESFDATAQYLTICMCGTVFIYIYNALSSALRGIGESVHTMLYVLMTTVENILLDLLFVAVFGWGAAGAAAATVISQLTSMCLVIRYTKKSTKLFSFARSSFRIHAQKLGSVLSIGLPQAIQFTATNLSFLCISSLINSYGVSASAAAGAANKLSTFGTLPGMSCMSGIVTMTAQNQPGGSYKRIIRGMFCGMAASVLVSGVVFALCQITPEGMYGLFTTDTSVAEIGVSYLRIYAISFFDEVIMFCMFGVLTGSGYTTVTMTCSFLSAFGVRYAGAYLLSRFTSLGFNGIALAYSVAPLVGISIGGFYLISGRWKKSRIRIK